jgi:hypothetical protein
MASGRRRAPQGLGVSQPDVALREGDLDPFLGEAFGDAVVDLGLDGEDLVHVAQDHADAEIEAVRAEARKSTPGSGKAATTGCSRAISVRISCTRRVSVP